MAASVTFEFGGWSALAPEISQTEGDLTVTAKGKSLIGGRLNGNTLTSGLVWDAYLARYSGGLGVTTHWGDDHQVDGSEWFGDELVEFSFGKAVSLISVNFDLVGRSDDFRWGYDVNRNGSFGLGDWLSEELDIPGSTTFAQFGAIASSTFAIGAFGGDDEWKIRSMTVQYEDTPELAPVPLPAPALLLAGALGGFGLLARRRAKQGVPEARL